MNNGDTLETPLLGKSNVTLKRTLAGNVVVKTVKPSGTAGRFVNKQRRLSLVREIWVYKELASVRPRVIPTLEDTDGRTYLSIGYVEDVKVRDQLDSTDYHRVGAALLRFQTLLAPFDRRVVSKITDYGQTPLYWVCRLLLGVGRRELGYRKAIKCMRLVFSDVLRQRPLPDALAVHNDFGRYNALVKTSGEVFLIDFAGVFFSRRYPLYDACMYSLNVRPGDFSVERTFLNSYVEELQQYLLDKDVKTALDLSGQMRLALIRKLLGALASRKINRDSAGAYRAFLSEVVLDNDEYGKWLSDAVGDSALLIDTRSSEEL